MNYWPSMSMPGEPERLDYIIKEHEKLERRFRALLDMLEEKGLISHDEAVRVRTDESE